MKSFSQKTTLLLATAFLLFTVACDKTTVDPEYTVPTTYNFDNVSYSGQTDRLNMLEEMTTYMKTGNTSGTELNAAVLKNMFANENNPFSFTSTKQIKSKTFELDQDQFETYMDNIAAASQSTVVGSNGIAGVVESNDGAKNYLFDENGIEYTQLIEKGLMGACFYYQATSVYLSDDRVGPTVDNETVTPGEGTDMEHHWDEAFGYLGVPTNFPTNTEGVRFYGKYCNSRDGILGTNATLMDAFLAGRAAISNSDYDKKDEMIPVIRDTWELVSAATAIHYLNGGVADFGDDALRNHQLSEAIAFTSNLKYNPTKKITHAQIDEVLAFIGTNLYESTVADLNAAKDLISSVYGLDDIKDTL